MKEYFDLDLSAKKMSYCSVSVANRKELKQEGVENLDQKNLKVIIFRNIPKNGPHSLRILIEEEGYCKAMMRLLRGYLKVMESTTPLYLHGMQ